MRRALQRFLSSRCAAGPELLANLNARHLKGSNP